MELFITSLFCAVLIGCLLIHLPVYVALIIGLFIFIGYGKYKGFTFLSLIKMCLDGVSKCKNILICFIFIGALTALLRSSGCIATTVYYASMFIHPSYFVVLSFLLCMIVSVLTGTSFGTVATIGVICISVANAMKIPTFWVAGAIMSGIFWGDRCSPVSTSALLVATVTETNLYKNIKNMIRTSIIPTLVTILIYLGIGFLVQGQEASIDIISMFSYEFQLGIFTLIPLISILILALSRMDIKLTMAISAFIAGVLSVLIQHASIQKVLNVAMFGYKAYNVELQSIMNGGGIISFLNMTLIVCVASCYAGIFKETGLLDFIQRRIERLSSVIGVYATTLLVSFPVAAISCNQTLAIMLTNQLTENLEGSKELKALNLEDSVVLVCIFVPWCIAGQVPLHTIGASTLCLLAACYAYLLPLWRIIMGKYYEKMDL